MRTLKNKLEKIERSSKKKEPVSVRGIILILILESCR